MRICAICGKRNGSTTGFKTALKKMGLPNWKDDKAHPKCVVALGRKLEAKKNPPAAPYTGRKRPPTAR